MRRWGYSCQNPIAGGTSVNGPGSSLVGGQADEEALGAEHYLEKLKSDASVSMRGSSAGSAGFTISSNSSSSRSAISYNVTALQQQQNFLFEKARSASGTSTSCDTLPSTFQGDTFQKDNLVLNKNELNSVNNTLLPTLGMHSSHPTTKISTSAFRNVDHVNTLSAENLKHHSDAQADFDVKLKSRTPMTEISNLNTRPKNLSDSPLVVRPDFRSSEPEGSNVSSRRGCTINKEAFKHLLESAGQNVTIPDYVPRYSQRQEHNREQNQLEVNNSSSPKSSLVNQQQLLNIPSESKPEQHQHSAVTIGGTLLRTQGGGSVINIPHQQDIHRQEGFTSGSNTNFTQQNIREQQQYPNKTNGTIVSNLEEVVRQPVPERQTLPSYGNDFQVDNNYNYGSRSVSGGSSITSGGLVPNGMARSLSFLDGVVSKLENTTSSNIQNKQLAIQLMQSNSNVILRQQSFDENERQQQRHDPKVSVTSDQHVAPSAGFVPQTHPENDIPVQQGVLIKNPNATDGRKLNSNPNHNYGIGNQSANSSMVSEGVNKQLSFNTSAVEDLKQEGQQSNPNSCSTGTSGVSNTSNTTSASRRSGSVVNALSQLRLPSQDLREYFIESTKLSGGRSLSQQQSSNKTTDSEEQKPDCAIHVDHIPTAEISAQSVLEPTESTATKTAVTTLQQQLETERSLRVAAEDALRYRNRQLVSLLSLNSTIQKEASAAISLLMSALVGSDATDILAATTTN